MAIFLLLNRLYVLGVYLSEFMTVSYSIFFNASTMCVSPAFRGLFYCFPVVQPGSNYNITDRWECLTTF